MDRPRRELLDHVAGKENLCILTSRQQSNVGYRHCWVARHPGNDCVVSTTSREANQIFPLYLYSDLHSLTPTRRPNFSPDFLTSITQKLGSLPSPEATFYYIYAIFHSPTYRSRYAEFLKMDFPRVPLTSDLDLFEALGSLGQQLVELHLMKSAKLDTLITTFVSGGGNRTVDPGHPKYADGQVTINKQGDCFAGVPPEVWNFYVGGYQVCNKWLKDRKGRILSDEDVIHYQKIVVALQETIRLMEKIDQGIPSWPIE